MDFSRAKNFFALLVSMAVFTSAVAFVLSMSDARIFGQPAALAARNVLAQAEAVEPPHKLANPPQIINAVYITAWSAGSKKYLNYLSGIFDKTEINAVVVDIKDYSGMVSYNCQAPEVKKYGLYESAIPDINELVKFFHEKGIYVIGRIAVFEDPAYSKARPDLAVINTKKTTNLKIPVLWRDNNGLSWLDPSSKDVWDYNVALAKDVLAHGFDEINFDYVRFATDGDMSSMGFTKWDGKKTKAEVIKSFFSYLRDNLQGEKLSVDLFGQTTVEQGDMGIGQYFENSFLYFDFIAPMVYPSHYAKGFIGYDNPAAYPYEVIKYSMDRALERQVEYANKNSLDSGVFPATAAGRFRPWIQDFNMGALYNAEMIQKEIKALKDSLGNEYSGFMLWSPSNIYTQDAVLKSGEGGNVIN